MITAIVVIFIALIAAIALAPHPKSKPPPSLDDLQVPTAEDGREVIDVAGTVWIDDPNIIWFGDLSTLPIRASGGK